MERINKILTSEKYKEYVQKNKAAEENRIFCCHNMEHFLDVARIASILNLEEKLQMDRELIYAAALLHDIGRHLQYARGIPHEVASAGLAPDILTEAGFEGLEQEEILHAICMHRNSEVAGEKNLAGILYRADKLSRACFACEAEGLCDRKAQKKNLQLRY